MWIAYIATSTSRGSEWRPIIFQAQVRCGSVYVSSEDSTQAVTQTVVTATSVAEKKRRASKYTVAIGTSHGHVQAFLEDADSVLSALDQCQAEEKCLMLIKRPKDTARKMLKSHSWANLSVSEPQLFRQFNGVSLGQTEPVTHQPYMMRRSSDQQSVTSCETDRSDGRRRYVTARGKENLRRQGQRSLSDSTNDNYQLLSDATSVACDYHADRKGERIREHSRREKLYPSIPEDEQEINNNNNSSSNNNNGYNNNNSVLGNSKSHGLVYHSCMDITQASLPSNGHSDWSRQGGKRQTQDQRMQGQGQREHIPPQRQAFNGVHDPGDLDDGSRSQSLGNLSTGLTLSLVGQRKRTACWTCRYPPDTPIPTLTHTRILPAQLPRTAGARVRFPLGFAPPETAEVTMCSPLPTATRKCSRPGKRVLSTTLRSGVRRSPFIMGVTRPPLILVTEEVTGATTTAMLSVLPENRPLPRVTTFFHPRNRSGACLRCQPLRRRRKSSASRRSCGPGCPSAAAVTAGAAPTTPSTRRHPLHHREHRRHATPPSPTMPRMWRYLPC
ncbi:uncharacterized protein LOC112572385 isoform X2 [Pomacea canaliculata]|uniref:uncharacterized protein LOC112572385 isoform X2 n=1 Tax=Pomacea canaliculata TaxID=400727 RepID=UPI000D7316FF|nr:uncharacterized protein LOC112572385 isoform X2 [Pomacea canaliculata]